jgi:ATP-binding protein involved in chromosome partitioning
MAQVGPTGGVTLEGVARVKNVFAVGSGKGGVGKSTVAAAVAFGFKHRGAKVGLLDADVYGPSVPHLLGLEDAAPPVMENNQLQPIDVDGMPVMSVAFIPGAERGRPMIVRGPILHRLMQQFLQQVNWGELDYLVIDLPPTTGDVPLSLSQLMPLSGGVIVCTPQDVAVIDAERALNMYRQLNVPVLGIVENMSYFLCPHCGERTEIFGTGGARKMAEQESVAFLGEIPMNLILRTKGDEGKFADVFADDSPLRAALLEICERLEGQMGAQPELPSLEG